MSPRIDRVARSIDLARRIASGELSETAGAIQILKFAHDCGTEMANSVADKMLESMRPREHADMRT